MANLFDNSVVYITADDMKDSTSNSKLSSLDPSEIDKLIVKAQDAIDRYVICYGVKFVDTQEFIFPIKDDDGNSLIPNDIQRATLYVVEHLFANKDVSNNKIKRIIKENVLGHNVEYDSSKTGVDLLLPTTAKEILKWYRPQFIKQVI